MQPDVVCYDALINAYGWSTGAGKAKKCYDIFKKMMNLYTSGKNPRARPDIITCNSVLNACAYEKVDPKEVDVSSETIMNMVVDTFETFQTKAPEFGWPNHMTFANVLMAISRHVPPGAKRTELAEAAFLQCCQSGHVSVLVITQLHAALPWGNFAKLMGPALFSGENEKLGFNLRKLPPEWVRFAPSPKQRKASRPSMKHKSVQVTKTLIAKQQQDRQKNG